MDKPNILALLTELDALAKEAPEGPVYVSADDAEDTIYHAHSGLAMIDTGRTEDWSISRLQEWNEARFYAALRNAYPALRDALRERQEMPGCVRALISCAVNACCCAPDFTCHAHQMISAVEKFYGVRHD